MFSIINIVTVLVWLAIMAICFIILYKPRSRLARSKTIEDVLNNSKINNNRFLKWFNPFINTENDRFHADISTKEYWKYVMLTMIISTIFLIFILRIWFAVPIILIVTFAMPTFMQFLKKRKHKTAIYNLISTYISTTANLASTFGNPLPAYKEILKRRYIAEPMYSDIERLVLMLESNVPLDEAFKEFERKYGNNSYLRLFHQNLKIQTERGGNMSTELFEISTEYDEMLVKRQSYFLRKLNKKKGIYLQAGMVLSAPIIFLAVMFDYYGIFIHSFVGRMIMLLVFIMVIISVLQSEREVNKDIFK